MQAYEQERSLLAAIRRDVPSLASGSMVLVDGICPYRGPAVVFESYWDLKGALALVYDDPSLRAYVVTPRLEAREDAVRTEIYGSIEMHYPYGENVLLYDVATGRTRALESAEDARRQLRRSAFEPGRDCPAGREAYGESVLPADRLFEPVVARLG